MERRNCPIFFKFHVWSPYGKQNTVKYFPAESGKELENHERNGVIPQKEFDDLIILMMITIITTQNKLGTTVSILDKLHKSD